MRRPSKSPVSSAPTACLARSRVKDPKAHSLSRGQGDAITTPGPEWDVKTLGHTICLEANGASMEERKEEKRVSGFLPGELATVP